MVETTFEDKDIPFYNGKWSEDTDLECIDNIYIASFNKIETGN